jgi:hypothetical protein
MDYLSLYSGSLCAVIYTFLVLPGKKDHTPLIKPTIFPIIYKGMFLISLNKDKALHIHHWVIFLIILLYLLYIKKKYYFLIGVSIVLIVQGLLYSDRFKFIYSNPYYKF